VSVPRFLADEDLRHAIVRATRRFDPVLEFSTATEVGLSGALDPAVLEFARTNRWLVVSHDVNTMKAAAEAHIAAGHGISGLLLAPQFRATRPIAESLVLIWAASEAEEWRDRIVYLPLQLGNRCQFLWAISAADKRTEPNFPKFPNGSGGPASPAPLAGFDRRGGAWHLSAQRPGACG
jgi:hypothetical protein